MTLGVSYWPVDVPYDWTFFTDAVTKATTVIYRNYSAKFHFTFTSAEDATVWLAEVKAPVEKETEDGSLFDGVPDTVLLRIMGRAYKPFRPEIQAEEEA